MHSLYSTRKSTSFTTSFIMLSQLVVIRFTIEKCQGLCGYASSFRQWSGGSIDVGISDKVRGAGR